MTTDANYRVRRTPPFRAPSAGEAAARRTHLLPPPGSADVAGFGLGTPVVETGDRDFRTHRARAHSGRRDDACRPPVTVLLAIKRAVEVRHFAFFTVALIFNAMGPASLATLGFFGCLGLRTSRPPLFFGIGVPPCRHGSRGAPSRGG
jgi:hypothetical protein